MTWLKLEPDILDDPADEEDELINQIKGAAHTNHYLEPITFKVRDLTIKEYTEYQEYLALKQEEAPEIPKPPDLERPNEESSNEYARKYQAAFEEYQNETRRVTNIIMKLNDETHLKTVDLFVSEIKEYDFDTLPYDYIQPLATMITNFTRARRMNSYKLVTPTAKVKSHQKTTGLHSEQKTDI